MTLAAQTAESDQRITQVLISEIQQLRMAIERSTLLGTRTQLAISKLQLQENAVARIKQQLDGVQAQAAGMNGQKIRVAETIKQLEQERATVTDPRQIQDVEA